MMVNTTRLFQTLGILGFVLVFFQIGIGWFIGFFFSGLLFLTLKNKEGKRSSIHLIVGLLITIYSFYALYSQSNFF